MAGLLRSVPLYWRRQDTCIKVDGVECLGINLIEPVGRVQRKQGSPFGQPLTMMLLLV